MSQVSRVGSSDPVERRTCEVCGSASRPWRLDARNILGRCSRCGHVQRDLASAPAGARSPAYGGDPGLDRWRLAVTYRRLRQRIPGPRSRVFEVGFGSGALLRRFLDDGAVVAGVDPGDLRVDVDPLVARTGTLHSAMLEELPPIEQQDLVVAVHVVEHVADVQGFARACHDMLAPGGCVVLVTPAGDSLSLAIFRASWWMLEDPTHVRFLTARSATRLLEDAGLADVQVRRLVLDSLGAGTASCVRRLRRRTPLPEGVLSSGVTRVLVLACAPAVVLLRLLVPGLRPVMEVTARRPDRTR